MPFVLKPFGWAQNGFDVRSLSIGDEVDDFGSATDGLMAEGFIGGDAAPMPEPEPDPAPEPEPEPDPAPVVAAEPAVTEPAIAAPAKGKARVDKADK